MFGPNKQLYKHWHLLKLFPGITFWILDVHDFCLLFSRVRFARVLSKRRESNRSEYGEPPFFYEIFFFSPTCYSIGHICNKFSFYQIILGLQYQLKHRHVHMPLKKMVYWNCYKFTFTTSCPTMPPTMAHTGLTSAVQ